MRYIFVCNRGVALSNAAPIDAFGKNITKEKHVIGSNGKMRDIFQCHVVLLSNVVR